MAAKLRSTLRTGGTPAVDLLPQAQRAELLHEATLGKLLLAIIASGIIAGLLWAAGIMPVAKADEELRTEEQTSAELLQEVAEHAETQQILNASNELTRARQQLTEREVLFADLADEVRGRLPAGATLSGYGGSLAAPEGAESAPASSFEVDLNPVCVAETATLTVQVLSDEFVPPSRLASSLESVSGFQCIVSTLIEEGQTAPQREVTLQVALGPEALADRFIDEEAQQDEGAAE